MLDAHFDETRDRARRVAGVQRRQDEMPGERGGERELRRLVIADLADHQNVGIAAEHRAKRRRECDAEEGIHLDLVRAGA